MSKLFFFHNRVALATSERSNECNIDPRGRPCSRTPPPAQGVGALFIPDLRSPTRSLSECFHYCHNHPQVVSTYGYLEMTLSASFNLNSTKKERKEYSNKIFRKIHHFHHFLYYLPVNKAVNQWQKQRFYYHLSTTSTTFATTYTTFTTTFVVSCENVPTALERRSNGHGTIFYGRETIFCGLQKSSYYTSSSFISTTDFADFLRPAGSKRPKVERTD